MVIPAAPTQMIILPIKATVNIENSLTKEGRIWAQGLDIFESWPGFRRLYWGKHVEEPGKTQVHIVRDTLFQHYSFLASPRWQDVVKLLAPICSESGDSFTVRHAMISDFTPNPKSLGKGAPVTGTAIYLATDTDGWEKVWALWTTIVPTVPGCLGCAGGWMVESVEGHQNCYIVWVGWQNVEVHNAYHHTKGFRRRGPILMEHNKGWKEYGHVAFTHSRTKPEANL